MPGARYEGANLQLTFPEDPPGTAVIRIGGFFGDDYETFLKNAFEQINEREIEHLVIDLRNNGGGQDTYGSMLYSTGGPMRRCGSNRSSGPI